MMINTTIGLVDEHELLRTVGLEDRPMQLVVWIEYRTLGLPRTEHRDLPLVRRDVFAANKELSDELLTTEGVIAMADLDRTLELRTLDTDVSVGTVYRRRGQDTIIRRDAWVIALKAPVDASGVAASLG